MAKNSPTLIFGKKSKIHSTNLLVIANTLAPIFIVVALGWSLRYWHFLSARTVQDFARLTYWVGLPTLVFYKIAASDLLLQNAGSVFAVTAGATALSIVLGYTVAWSLGIPKQSIGTFVQAVFRGNLAFVGLPVIIYGFSTPEYPSAAVAEATALVVFGPLVVLYNIAAILVLHLSQAAPKEQGLLGSMGITLLANPLVIACLAGLACTVLEWRLPLAIERTLAAVGQMALPLALLCLGGSLASVRLRSSLLWSVCAVLIKVVVTPLLGLGLALLLRLDAEGTRIALILLACPTATVTYILVTQIGGDPDLASSIVLLSTLLAGVSLAVILALT